MNYVCVWVCVSVYLSHKLFYSEMKAKKKSKNKWWWRWWNEEDVSCETNLLPCKILQIVIIQLTTYLNNCACVWSCTFVCDNLIWYYSKICRGFFLYKSSSLMHLYVTWEMLLFRIAEASLFHFRYFLFFILSQFLFFSYLTRSAKIHVESTLCGLSANGTTVRGNDLFIFFLNCVA